MAAPAPSPASVRYEGAGPRERGFLLRALVEAWHNKCYWCNTSGMSEFEIDHLVPPGKADEGIAKYNLPVGFDVQSPENLAPTASPDLDAIRGKATESSTTSETGWLSRRYEKRGGWHQVLSGTSGVFGPVVDCPRRLTRSLERNSMKV